MKKDSVAEAYNFIMNDLCNDILKEFDILEINIELVPNCDNAVGDQNHKYDFSEKTHDMLIKINPSTYFNVEPIELNFIYDNYSKDLMLDYVVKSEDEKFNIYNITKENIYKTMIAFINEYQINDDIKNKTIWENTIGFLNNLIEGCNETKHDIPKLIKQVYKFPEDIDSGTLNCCYDIFDKMYKTYLMDTNKYEVELQFNQNISIDQFITSECKCINVYILPSINCYDEFKYLVLENYKMPTDMMVDYNYILDFIINIIYLIPKIK